MRRPAAEAFAAGKVREGLGRLDKMGAIVEVENPTARRVQMVAEWFAASEETKSVRTKAGVQERAKTALMVAPTWAEIDSLNQHAREKLRAAGKLSREEQVISTLRAKTWTKAQQKDARNYEPGDVLVTHKATKCFAKGDELRVVRKEQRRLIVQRGGEEISVSPRQSGLAWTVAFPYTSLIKVELARDETALELSFVTHRVSGTGRKLAEIYKAVTDVEARPVRVVSNEFAGNPALPTYRALVHGIRIDALDADERRKQ